MQGHLADGVKMTKILINVYLPLLSGWDCFVSKIVGKFKLACVVYHNGRNM